jgi:hypothetical protein
MGSDIIECENKFYVCVESSTSNDGPCVDTVQYLCVTAISTSVRTLLADDLMP